MLLLSAAAQAADTRFDSVYFFQTEDVLKQKQVDFKDMARFSRQLQSQVWKVLKSAKLNESAGYVVVAVRSDGEVMAWMDMEPALDAYYDYHIIEAIKKLPPFSVSNGIAVFAIKMAVNTPKHTKKAVPAPQSWKAAKAKLADPNDIEQLVLSMWDD
jgi:hypothetical protein